jgi:ABC-type cobalamin/Fe3+-siderophores transport system ATPase subunit
MNGKIIYLLGPAGSGKLTIAKAVRQCFSCILLDNHLINNVVFSLIDPDGKTALPEAVWNNIARVRAAALDTMRDLSKPDRSFILTNELIEGNPRHAAVFEDVRRVALVRNAALVPVRLSIRPEVVARRVASPGRAEMYKEIDPDEAARKARETTVLRPVGVKYLDLDVSDLSPEQAAVHVLSFANGIGAGEVP